MQFALYNGVMKNEEILNQIAEVSYKKIIFFLKKNK